MLGERFCSFCRISFISITCNLCSIDMFGCWRVDNTDIFLICEAIVDTETLFSGSCIVFVIFLINESLNPAVISTKRMSMPSGSNHLFPPI